MSSQDVQRYGPSPDGEMCPDFEGEFVSFADYEHLLKNVKLARAVLQSSESPFYEGMKVLNEVAG